MASVSKTTVTKAIPNVDEFINGALVLIKAVGAYAGESFSDQETNGQLAELQVVASALQTAIQQATMRASQRGMAPVPAPTPQGDHVDRRPDR